MSGHDIVSSKLNYFSAAAVDKQEHLPEANGIEYEAPMAREVQEIHEGLEFETRAGHTSYTWLNPRFTESVISRAIVLAETTVIRVERSRTSQYREQPAKLPD